MKEVLVCFPTFPKLWKVFAFVSLSSAFYLVSGAHLMSDAATELQSLNR